MSYCNFANRLHRQHVTKTIADKDVKTDSIIIRNRIPASVTPNGHSVRTVMAGDSKAQNAVVTTTPTMYNKNVHTVVSKHGV